MPELQLQGVSKRFVADRPAVEQLKLRIPAGQRLALIGPSGCGKTTTLRMIAGLDEPDEGTITLGEKRLNGLAPARRGVAMVMQQSGLVPGWTVEQALRLGVSRSSSDKRGDISSVAKLLDISSLHTRRIATLSGGEAQRVALGRALLAKPQALLLDEPMQALDCSLRDELRRAIIRLQESLNMTTLLVTHDQHEALAFGQQIAVMQAGKILQQGPSDEVYRHPHSPQVAGLLGRPSMNLFYGNVVGNTFEHAAFRMRISPPCAPGHACLGIRPEDIRLSQTISDTLPTGIIRERESVGDSALLCVEIPQASVWVKATPNHLAALGDRVSLQFAGDALRVWPHPES